MMTNAEFQDLRHELRTPLTIIIGYTTLLGQPGLDGDTRAEYVMVVVDAATEIAKRLTDAL